MRLEIADDDVDALTLQLVRFGQHLVGLADAGGIAEEHLETTPARCGIGHGQCGKTRTSMPSASRIRRSSGVPSRRVRQVRRRLWPTKICVMPCTPRVVENRVDRILALEDVDVRVLRPGQRHVPFERGAILGGQVGLRHVDREQLAVEAVGVPPAAGEHLGGVRARRHADENPFLRAPRRLDAVQPEIRLELAIDDVGGQQQRALAKLRQIAAASIAVSGLGRRIDDDDFVGTVDEVLRHGLGWRSCPGRS